MSTTKQQLEKSGAAEAVVIVKAAPQIGQKHGETVCCAAIDIYGNWLRLYPVSFQTLDDGKKFGRWDRIKFQWRIPNDDPRPESRRIDQDTLEIVGQLKKNERHGFLAGRVVSSLVDERKAGRSFALLKPEILEFEIQPKPKEKIAKEAAAIEQLRKQEDLFNSKPIIPRTPCPMEFRYRYRTDDGERTGRCQDWETEATFFKWRERYGEDKAVAEMQKVFGEEYPKKGVLFAMGTHSLYPDTWLMNGIVRMNELPQGELF
ncbi:MAG: hypothetical protein AAFR20_04765 [Pseudomonadota bacterium]